MKRATAVFVLVCAVLGVFGACARGAIQPGEARLSMERGRAEVTRRGEPERLVTDDLTLRTGDRVKVVRGEARMRLAEGRELWLRDGSDVTVGAHPRLNAGDVVALADDDEGLTVRAAGAVATVLNGAARVRRDLGMSTGTYEGAVRLTTASKSLRVPAYRQASVPSIGLLPVRPTPLAFQENDEWDRRFLGVAMELTADLQRRSEGFTAQLDPGEGRSPGFYRMLLPDLDARGFEPTLVDGTRGPGETLVGAAIALRGERGSLSDRWRQIFSFRDEGAAWGLVALDQAVNDVPGVRSVLTEALGRLPGSGGVAIAAPSGAPAATLEVPSPPSVSGSRPSAPGSVPSTVAPPKPQPAAPPPAPTMPTPVTLPPVVTPPPTPGPIENLLDPVVEPVVDTVGSLVGGLLR